MTTVFHFSLARRAVLAAMLLFSVGCSTIKDVRFQDSSVDLPSMRLAKSLTETMRLEVEHARTEGSGAHSLEVDELVHLDDLRIWGPAELESSFALRAVKVGVGLDLLTRENVELKVGAGVSELKVDLEFRDETQRHQFDHTNRGAYGQFTVVLPITRAVGLSVHAGINKFFDEGSGHMSDLGLRLLFRPDRNLEFFAGWFNWDYYNEELKSDIRIDAQGLAYGMQVVF